MIDTATVVAMERECIGCIMLDPLIADQVAAILTPQDFLDPFHRRLFAVIQALTIQREPCDAMSIRNAMGADVLIGQITDLAAEQVSAIYGLKRAKDLLEVSKLRALEAVAIELKARIDEATLHPNVSAEIIAEHTVAMDLITDRAPGKAPILLADTEKDLLPRVYGDVRTETGWSTGFVDVDDGLGGLRDGEMIVLAARPSVGKSLFAASIGEYLAIDAPEPRPVLFLSMEMSGASLYRRFIFGRSQVSQSNALAGSATESEKQELERAHLHLKASRWYVHAEAAITSQRCGSLCRAFQAKHGKPLIIVDYLQLMRGPGNSRYEIVTNLSNDVKSIAQDLQCPVLVLAQLNRAVDKTVDKVPTLSDLRDSGAIEQDADAVIFLSRDTMSQNPHPMTVTIAKNRPGTTGSTQVLFDTKGPRIRNLARVEVFK